jgi:hypothetical protein
LLDVLAYLDQRGQSQAAEQAAAQAKVIHARKEGELELERRNSALIWSGVAAGLSMEFSFLSFAL